MLLRNTLRSVEWAGWPTPSCTLLDDVPHPERLIPPAHCKVIVLRVLRTTADSAVWTPYQECQGRFTTAEDVGPCASTRRAVRAWCVLTVGKMSPTAPGWEGGTMT